MSCGTEVWPHPAISCHVIPPPFPSRARGGHLSPGTGIMASWRSNGRWLITAKSGASVTWRKRSKASREEEQREGGERERERGRRERGRKEREREREREEREREKGGREREEGEPSLTVLLLVPQLACIGTSTDTSHPPVRVPTTDPIRLRPSICLNNYVHTSAINCGLLHPF